MVFSKYAKISLDMLRIPQGLIFCIFYKNWIVILSKISLFDRQW